MGVAVGSSDTSNEEQATIQVGNGVVEVADANGDLVPVAGDSTFELVAALESTDPWTVAGKTLETNDSTQIDEGLQVGDLVRVRGLILEDGTWLALSIELAEEQAESTIILIGIVTSIDPWVVNGIELNVTDATDIQGDITVGMLVRVEILLLPDGTWQVVSIAPLGDVGDTPGCATVVATVVSVNGDEIQFLGWPSPVIFQPGASTDHTNTNGNGEEGDEQGGDEQGGDEGNHENTNGSDVDITTLSADQVVLVVVCVSDNGQLVIVQIIVLNSGEDGGGTTTDNGQKVLVCHKPNKKGGKTLSLPQSAVPAHLGHGDTLGACP